MNNTTAQNITDICGYSETYWTAARIMTYITYTIIPPICFIIGMPGHILALLTFFKHRNEETAYSYQILTTVSRILEILFMSLFSLMFYHGAGQDWSGEGSGDGPVWFMANYPLMWFTCHFIPMLAEAFVSVAVFTSAATAADRVFALWKPIIYISINHRLHVVVASILCFLIPLIVAMHMSFHFDLVWKTEKYYIQYSDFSSSPFEHTLSQIASSTRSIAQFVLILSSIVMVLLFKKRNVKVQTMIIKDEKKEAKRKAAERTLVVLALFQSVATTVPSLLITVWEIGLYFSDTFAMCEGAILSPLTDILLEVANAVDFYVMILVSDSSWTMVMEALKHTGTNTAVSLIPAPNMVIVKPMSAV